MFGHALDRSRIEQIGRVFDDDVQCSLTLSKRKIEVELRGTVADTVDDGGNQTRQPQRSGGHVLQPEGHLKEGVARRIAPEGELLHQLCEGHILVRIRRQCALAYPREAVDEAGLPGQIAAQHQHVDEIADHSLQLGPRASRNRHADGDVFLSTVAIEEDLKSGEQGHEQRRALTSPELLQLQREIFCQRESHAAAAVAGCRRARSIRGQLQHRQPCQCLLPKAELPFVIFPLQPIALPERVVGVLHRQLGQRRWPPVAERLVQQRELVLQHSR